ncbi:MAG: glycosyltransferase family 4 protein [Magnetococcales bacterium]|nr:glycosyltransferase family 4 protein [Magnetococcales bacterium]
MNILILSFYYHPDLSAGSFRATALVKELLAQMPPNGHVEVITTMPNRYSTFSALASPLEQHTGLTIHRIALPQHNSGMIDQSKSFLVYFWKALHLVHGQQYDIIFATSSRLMTAVLGAWVALLKKKPLYLDIRDIFVDTIQDILPKKLVFLIKPFFSVLERFAIGNACHINLVSYGFKEYFTSRYPNHNFSFYTNGIDDEFIETAQKSNQILNKRSDLIQVLYAGNLGEGQGLHNILPKLAKLMESKVQFTVIGDGGRKIALQKALAEARVNTVIFLPPIKRNKLIEAYLGCDVLFLHLNNHEAFRKVLPSKIFEYAAIGKPIWAGVGGYAAEFLRLEVANVAIFPPCNALKAEQIFHTLSLTNTPRPEFVAKYARYSIAKKMSSLLLSLSYQYR